MPCARPGVVPPRELDCDWQVYTCGSPRRLPVFAHTCFCPYTFSARQVLWESGLGSNTDLIAGIEQATIDGVDVISMSLGYDGEYDTLSSPQQLAVMNAGETCCVFGACMLVSEQLCARIMQAQIFRGFRCREGLCTRIWSRGRW